MAKPVGFDQKITLEDLDFTARETGISARTEMYKKLDKHLLARVKGDKARKNTTTILMKIWYLVDDDHSELQKAAMKLLPKSSADQRLVVHWGMTLLAYPFFRDLVKELGNLFILQDEVASTQIGRKMKNLYGDRRRVEVATSAVLSSLFSWGVLERVTAGYKHNNITIEDAGLKIWLLNVLLQASGSNIAALDVLLGSPETFPFEYNVSAIDFEHGPLSISWQGMEMTVVSIK